MKKTIDRIRRLAGILCLCLLLILCAVLISPHKARADAVTDTLTVAVGYWGMDLSDYAVAGTYHWSELETNLPIYELAYSYFQSGYGTDYTAVVDSARGFLVQDLLDYANIYYGDIYNLQFYVTDHQGIQAAFDRDSLFGMRYYFEDFPFHLERIYEEGTNNLIGYGYDEVWNYAYYVPPMLALEDNWTAFSQEFEHIGPNFEAMSASNRFRLLFGQSYPTETLTSDSAKYVSCVYVTLWGSPSFGEMPELENTLGAHEATLQVMVDDLSLKNALSEYMRLNSTNEEVLRITGLTYTPVEGYSDLVNVTISYEIVGEGNASIIADLGGSTSAVEVSQNVAVSPPEQIPTGEPDNPPVPTEPASDEPSGSSSENPSGETDHTDNPTFEPTVEPVPSEKPENASKPASVDDSTEKASTETENREQLPKEEASPIPEQKPNEAEQAEQPKEQPEEPVPELSETNPETAEQLDLPDLAEKEQAEILNMAEVELETAAADTALHSLETKVLGFRLSDQKARNMKEAAGENTVGVAAEPLPEAADIIEVKIEDHSDELAEKQRRILLWTGLVSASVCLAGAGSELAVFRKKLGR